ncbi:hypothetical protein Patl1_14266 [Pistacia atlantica]|uniref:Uncharacterized protein n=1 Tax=Pistacia atlantica TaxID=434234 RepID=A0ACC1AXX8_9ROSI|nr:hypothetical protein Patl1_14266 [Pistacia atlantica]
MMILWPLLFLRLLWFSRAVRSANASAFHKHASYQSLAKALRQMFVDGGDVAGISEHDLDLSNAVPGHLIAYEDMENDLLLAGDLNWKDFVRVAKRIRILPVKGNSRKGGREREKEA